MIHIPRKIYPIENTPKSHIIIKMRQVIINIIKGKFTIEDKIKFILIILGIVNLSENSVSITIQTCPTMQVLTAVLPTLW